MCFNRNDFQENFWHFHFIPCMHCACFILHHAALAKWSRRYLCVSFFNYFFKLHIKISLNYHHRILLRFLIWKKNRWQDYFFFRHLTIFRMVYIYLFIESIIVDSRAIKRHNVKKGCLISVEIFISPIHWLTFSSVLVRLLSLAPLLFLCPNSLRFYRW